MMEQREYSEEEWEQGVVIEEEGGGRKGLEELLAVAELEVVASAKQKELSMASQKDSATMELGAFPLPLMVVCCPYLVVKTR